MEVIEARLQAKPASKIMAPHDNKSIIYLIDDINMAHKDKWGH